MVGKSRASDIDLSREYAAGRISEFLSDLSLMDDVSKKVSKLDNFVHALEDELKRIVNSKYQFTCSVRFLQEAIVEFKEMKRDCEVHAASKEPIPCESVFVVVAKEEDILVTNEMKDWLSSAKLWGVDTHSDSHCDSHQFINLVSDDEEEVHNVSNHQSANLQAGQNSNGGTFHLNLDQKRSGLSIRGGISLSSGPMVLFEPVSIDPREKCVRNIHGPSSFAIGQEPPMKKGRVWSADLQRKFLLAMQILDGPLATPRQILNFMQVDDDLTEDEIRTHMLNHRLALHFGPFGVSPHPPTNDTLAKFRQDVLQVGGNLIQPGPQQMPLYIGESSNGQVAAAAAANNTIGVPMAVSKACGRLPLPPPQYTHSGFTQSGSQQIPPHTGGFSNRRMAAAATRANRGRKSVKKPYNKN